MTKIGMVIPYLVGAMFVVAVVAWGVATAGSSVGVAIAAVALVCLVAGLAAAQCRRRGEDKYHALFDDASDAILLLREGVCVECNKAAHRMFGRSEQELTGHDAFAFSAPSQPDGRTCAEAAREHLARAAQGKDETFEWQFVDAQGALIDTEVTLHMLTVDGEPVLMATIRDIAERMMAAQALRDHDQLYSELYENGSAVMLLIDPEDGTYVDANAAACAFYGYSRAQLTAMHLADINTAPREELRDVVALARREGLHEFHFQHRLADGAIRDVEVNASTVTIRGKDLIFSIVTDETDRNRALEALQQSEYALAVRNRIADVFLVTPEEEMYSKVLEVVLDETRSGFGLFGYIDESGALVAPSLTRDVWEQCQMDNKDIVFPRDCWGGVWGESLRHEKTICANQGLGVPEGHVPINNALAVPIMHQNRLVGALVVANRPGGYGQTERTFMEDAARYIAPLLDARLRREIEQRERQRAEAETRRFQTIAGEMNHGMAITDLDGTLLYVNDYFARVHGCSVEELTGQPLFETLQAERDALFGQLIRDGEMRALEVWHRHRDGSTFPMLMNAVVVQEDGQPAYIAASAVDITERKRLVRELEEARDRLEKRVEARTAELARANESLNDEVEQRRQAAEALRESEERFRLLAENMPGVVYVRRHDAQFSHLYCNDQIQPLTGYPRDAFMRGAVQLSELIAPDDFLRVRQEIDKAVEQHEPYALTYRLRHQSGEWLWIEEFGTGIYREGELQFLEGYQRDVTEEKQAQDHLRVAYDELENRVEARTAELRAAREAAETANRHKSTFLSSMSHELRTPLNAILGFAQLLQNGADGLSEDKRRDYVQLIESSGRMLLALINDLLDITKVDAGKMEVAWQDFSPAECIDEPINIIETQFRMSKQLQFGVDIASDVSTLCGDRRMCKQILLNLLSNAAKYSPSEGRVDVEVRRDRDGWVRFDIVDQGIGIAPEKQDRIFNEFYQTDQVRDAELGGTGIGLALTRRLVHLHGGDIGVESAVGKGSRFWFTFPCAAGGEMPTVEPEKTRPVASDPAADLSGRRVLIVEDNEINLIVLTDLLSTRGIRPDIARNGQEALEKAEQTDPEVVLMDIRMPIMDGLEATRRLRAHPRFRDVPVVALSASADATSVEYCREAGCSEHMAKPVEAARLFEVLTRYLT